MEEEFLGKGLGSAFRLLAHRKGAGDGRPLVYHALRWEDNTINRLQGGGGVVSMGESGELSSMPESSSSGSVSSGFSTSGRPPRQEVQALQPMRNNSIVGGP